MNESSHREDAIAALRKQLKGLHFAMLTTVEEGGGLRSRPMTAQELDDDGCLWFFTGKSTSKMDEVRQNQQVNVAFAHEKDNRFVSLGGTAEAVDDRDKMAQLWNPLYKAWFPDGLEDPDIVLLKVQVEHAEYWDAASSKLVQAVGFVKAVVTGRREDGKHYHDLHL